MIFFCRFTHKLANNSLKQANSYEYKITQWLGFFSWITSVEFQIAKNTLVHSLIHFADLVPKSEKKNTELYCLSVNEGMNEVELK